MDQHANSFENLKRKRKHFRYNNSSQTKWRSCVRSRLKMNSNTGQYGMAWVQTIERLELKSLMGLARRSVPWWESVLNKFWLKEKTKQAEGDECFANFRVWKPNENGIQSVAVNL